MSPEINESRKILKSALDNPRSFADFGLRSIYIDAASSVHRATLEQCNVDIEDVDRVIEESRGGLAKIKDMRRYCKTMANLAEALPPVAPLHQLNQGESFTIDY